MEHEGDVGKRMKQREVRKDEGKRGRGEGRKE